MAHQPADTLKDRSFVGLIIAQFLAGFNDQFIHAAAMFYAIHTEILNEAQAISLMPILFYAPWAIFCTIAGYLADRFSKRNALVIWKVAEIVIAGIALAGFLIGPPVGSWLVMSTVFLMGTHAAFFAPAKYGAMPQILQPHVLSRGNGILESTTFLAAILGTVSGGLLSHVFRGREFWIGIVLVGLAVIGVVASVLIAYLPASNPARLFPKNLFKPLWENLKLVFRSRPLALAVLGIAFFIFMVAYMRATMYMHGETRNPKWNEFKTSLIVATVALGVGLGSPLAGFLSGGKIELGLVPLGCLGIIVGTLFAAFALNVTAALVIGLIIIGFFSGFYMVPLYTLLQHRAPKERKGDIMATSNFVNVTGAMAASLLFFLLVQVGRWTGMTPLVEQTDGVAEGVIRQIDKDEQSGNPVRVVITSPTGEDVTFQAKSTVGPLPTDDPDTFYGLLAARLLDVLEFDDNAFEIGAFKKGDRVIVSRFQIPEHFGDELKPVTHFRIREASRPMSPVFNNEGLPMWLFLGAAGMTLTILILLVRKLPDFFVRTLFWARALGRYRITVVGMHNLPTNGPVILATNCDQLDSSLQVVAATDRYTHFILVERENGKDPAKLLRYLVERTGFTMVPAGQENPALWDTAANRAIDALKRNDLLAVTVDGASAPEAMLKRLPWSAAPVVPVYCGAIAVNGQPPLAGRVHVVFGPPLQPAANLEDIRRSIRHLGDSDPDAADTH
jgi:MFS family permease/1-acyl-sn-glycerol-3-phosphate acyltransferase